MNVLVSTHETQGKRQGDFCFVPDGELLYFSMECDSDRDNVDGRCGCRRSLTGMKTLTGTTTAKIAVVDMTPETFRAHLREAFEGGGWAKAISAEELEAWLQSDSSELLRIAAHFSPGTIVEKRGDTFLTRRTADGYEPPLA